MQICEKLDIDLYDFFRVGKFDYLKLGQTKEWILANFPDPDDWSAEKGRSTMMNVGIWRYGNLELHFDGDKLSMIFSDYIDDLDGGKWLALDKWLLNEPTRLTLQFMMDEFLKLDWPFSIEPMARFGLTILHLKNSGVQLCFNAPDGDDAPLDSVLMHPLRSFALKVER